MAKFVADGAVHMGQLIIRTLQPSGDHSSEVERNPTSIKYTYGWTQTYTGQFTHGVDVTTGTVTGFSHIAVPGDDLSSDWSITDISIDVAEFAKPKIEILKTIFAGDDTIRGSNETDALYGFDGDDVIYGNGGGMSSMEAPEPTSWSAAAETPSIT